MKILVFNGSPKPERTSVTMRHIDFLRVRFADHEFDYIPVSRKIHKIEHNNACFLEILEKVKQADLIIWAFPIYFYSVPGQLKRFIELINERKQTSVFQEKYATTISTSAGIFDYPAHEYIHATSEDFGMKYFPGFSFKVLHFKDLMNKEIRESYVAYFLRLLTVTQGKKTLVQKYPALNYVEKSFVPIQVDAEMGKSNGKTLLVISDHRSGTNLEKMVDFALKESRFSVDVVNIYDIGFKSGCMGCVQCQFTGKCIIPDDVNALFAERILNADAVVFAVTMKDRHISAHWKMLIDRSIFISKKNVYKHIHFAFIVSGPVLASCIMDEFISIYSSSRCLHHVGYVSDETGDSTVISRNLFALMDELEQNVVKNIKRPYLFYKRAYFYAMREAMFIYGLNSDVSKFYRKNKLFDFPQRTGRYIWIRMMFNFLFTFPITRKYFIKNLNSINARQYGKVVERYSIEN